MQAPPNLTYDDFPRLLDAGIDDWGGVSPVTIDHVNPEAPWPEVERLRAATESRGLELAPRLPVYPEFVAGEWVDPRVLPPCCAPSDSLGLAREDEWSPGEPGAVPFVVRATRCRSTRATSSARTRSSRLFRARGAERAARPRRRRRGCGAR